MGGLASYREVLLSPCAGAAAEARLWFWGGGGGLELIPRQKALPGFLPIPCLEGVGVSAPCLGLSMLVAGLWGGLWTRQWLVPTMVAELRAIPLYCKQVYRLVLHCVSIQPKPGSGGGGRGGPPGPRERPKWSEKKGRDSALSRPHLPWEEL